MQWSANIQELHHNLHSTVDKYLISKHLSPAMSLDISLIMGVHSWRKRMYALHKGLSKDYCNAGYQVSTVHNHGDISCKT